MKKVLMSFMALSLIIIMLLTGSVTPLALSGDTYTVTFDSNGGTAVASKTAAYNTTISAPADPAKPNYTFAGWYTSDGLQIIFPFTVTGNTTLYAHWNPVQYTVTFNSNGGSAVGSVPAGYNTTIAEPTAPTKNGYSFSGWYNSSSGGNKIVFPFTVTTNTTLYAQWAISSYTITFDSNGGSAVSSKTVPYNTTISAPTAPTRVGYTFKGWYATKEGEGEVSFPLIVMGSATFFAQWSASLYTVYFNSNGGLSVNSINAYYNSTITEPAAPTRPGYTFAGWYADTALTVPWNFNTDLVTYYVYLYAKWTPLRYTVSFNSNGGSAVDSITGDYGSKITVSTNPTKSGCTFGGWYQDPLFYSAWDFDSDTIEGNTTLYAKWNLDLTPGTQQQWIKDGIAWNYTPLGTGYCRIDSCGPAVGTLMIPETLNGRTVYSIGGSAFRGNTELTGVTLPDSLVVIEASAFENCTALANVNFGNGLTTINSYAFNNCTVFTTLNLPNSTILIGSYAFKGCTGITGLLIPNNVYSVNQGAFSGCTGLKKVTIGSSVDDIDPGAFSDCTNLVSACLLGKMPSYFASNAFYNCSSSFKIYYIEGKIDPISIYLTGYNFSTFTPLSGAPVSLIASDISGTSVTISWTPVVGATGYEIYLGSTKISTSTVYGTTYTVTGLLKYTAYQFTVKAINNITESPLSDPLSVTTKGLAGDINGDGSVNLVDVTLLSRYVAGWTVQVQGGALDINSDGLVNLMDVTLLSRFVAGWSVVLH